MDDRAETCRSIGNKLFNERDYTSALKFYREGLKLAIKHPKLNCNASAAAFNLGLIDESETYAVRAFTSQRNYEKAYFRAIKAAEKRNDWDRQLDYILKGMECCDTCGSLLEEAERIQHTMVLASFCRDSKVEDFFRQPKITQKVAQLDILMVKAKARKNNPSTPKPKTATATCDCRPVDEDSGFNPLSQSNSQTSAACDVPVNINVIPTPGKTSRPSVQIDPLREKDRENLVKPFRPPTTKPPTSAFPPKVATAAKDNIGSNVEVSRSSVQTPDKIFPPPVVSDMAKKNCEVPRDKSSQRAGKKTRTESGGSDCAKENEAKPNPASIAQEITTLFRNGREAFKNSLFLHAATYLTKARTLLRENSLEDLQEFVLCKVPLNYVICEAKVSCGEYTHIEDGIHSLRKLVEEEGSRKFPAAVYLLGVAFFKLNRFKEAREQLEEVDSLIKGNVNFNTYPWPGTFDVINATQKAYLKTETEYLLRQCSAYHKPDWICLFSECEEMSTHIIPSRKIYFNDPDFSGFLELLCSAKCALVFHRQCWKAYKERHAIRRLTDKAILGEPCLTPDCTDAVIIGITTFDKDGKVTHRDSIPAKSSDSSVPKSSSVPKLATPSKAKKPKTGSVPRAQIPTRPAKRATEEATADTADTEEGIMEYEAELKIRKIRLDDYRSRDKRWQQFDIKAPETIQFELTQEEKFVESFFEEVLKRKGPIHISCVEDYFKENKALLEEAVPSLRTFHNLLQLLLNRSCCFVLMDSVLGLAANVVDLYKTTKENAGIRFKIPPKKEPQHSVTIKTTIPTVVNAAEPFIPYKKNSLNPELARSQCPGFTGGILKDLKLSVADFKRLTSIELDFKPSARVSSHVGASKKRTFDGQQSASTDPFCKVSSPSEESQRAAFTGSLPKPPTSLGKSPALIPTQIPSTENNFDKVLMAEKKSNEILDLSEPLYIWEQDGWSELPPSKPLKPEETKCAVAKPLPNVVEDEKAPLKDCVKEFIQTFLKNTSMHEVQKTSLNASEPRNSSVSLTLKQEEQETLGISELESPHVPSTLKQEELEALLTVSEPKSSRSPTSMQEEQKTLWDVSEPKNSSVSSIFDGNNVDVISQGPFKPIPNSAPTPDTETKTPESYEERQELLAEKPCIRSLSEVSSNENNKLLSEDNDKDVSTDVSSECFIDKLVPVNFNSEETGTEEVKEKSQSGTSDDYLIPAPTANIPDDILHLHVPNLPVVNPEPKTTTIKPPISAFFDVEAKPSELLLPNKSATLEKDQLIEDSLLFEECTEDLFVIEDKDRCLIDDIPLDLSPVQKLVWNLKDLPDNGDLFAIDTEPVGGIPPEMDLFQVPGHKTEHVFSNGFDPPKPSREISLQRISKPPVRLVDGEDIFKTEDRWKLKQEQIDFVRLSFPREKYSRLIEGLSKIHDKRGPEVDKMALEDIVKELSDIFQLTPCDQQPSDGDGSTGNLGPQTRSTDTYKEDENWEYGNSPWKPSLLLVQVVRLSFPTEEFYKLMFALYLAKLYSDTTRFEELCDRVANVLSDINEGKCQDYNNEISIHGPYNEESRIIYGKAWRVLISTGSKANSE